MKALALLAIPILTAACSPAKTPEPAVNTAAEQAAVQQAITDMFDSALAVFDTAALRRTAAPEFIILEDGKWMNIDELNESIAALQASVGVPMKLKYTLSDWHTFVDGDIAWASFRNHLLVEPDGLEPMQYKWLESAVLKKTDGRWLLAHYHSAHEE